MSSEQESKEVVNASIGVREETYVYSTLRKGFHDNFRDDAEVAVAALEEDLVSYSSDDTDGLKRIKYMPLRPRRASGLTYCLMSLMGKQCRRSGERARRR